ncbi:AlpA family transcriptional regulator [Pigmentiphaga sp. GD03639]|uniref:helix-turn-helix transcriptional regulator n=1 Tax=Pigmentiphaga sp. GD03639 TaxID=2975354 RepID=UPI00244A4C1B|nr:AlpA family transcriptional regulator [Pigmentiphaga sp. GD03639]MDH2240193.1 AlpA family transcriptional regulator [Pigmentiphaga sp. GD03639]
MSNTSQHTESLLRLERVMDRVGLGRTSIYDEVKAGTFPRPVKRGKRSLWVESEVDAWIAGAITEYRTGKNP